MSLNVEKAIAKKLAKSWLVFLYGFCLSFFSGAAWAQDTNKLETIQQQIKAKQVELKQQLSTAKKLQDKLQKAELNIADTAKKLNETQTELNNNQKQQKVLLTQQKKHLDAIGQQKSVLAKQIRSAYMTGNYDFAKMLLNQDDAANFERTITYYQYLNKARKSQIDTFNGLVKELQVVNADLIDKQQQLENLKSTQLRQQQLLTSQQAEREKTLAQVRSSIKSDELKIAELQMNEKNLLEAISKAEALADSKQSISLDGLTKLKGRLLMPAQGRLRKMFGRFRQGQIKWKGVVIYGDVGSSVVAIHDAKVLYSNWLRGFGLLTVLDHGNGYMSLYGHNQALLKQAGETVKAGESVALLGQSGGQSRPNLYFEMRHKGKPINPTSWLKL